MEMILSKIATRLLIPINPNHLCFESNSKPSPLLYLLLFNVTMSKLLPVFGTTGRQGGSLITHVLNHHELSNMYQLRGITRQGSKPAAVALKEKRVEVVEVLEVECWR